MFSCFPYSKQSVLCWCMINSCIQIYTHTLTVLYCIDLCLCILVLFSQKIFFWLYTCNICWRASCYIFKSANVIWFFNNKKKFHLEEKGNRIIMWKHFFVFLILHKIYGIKREFLIIRWYKIIIRISTI